jgi:hypothetical protein
MQIGLNIAVLEDWVSMMDLPKGVASHFTPVRDLISWLQVTFSCLFSVLCLFVRRSVSLQSRSFLP